MSPILSPVPDRRKKPGTWFTPRSDHGGISPRWMSICRKDKADPSRTMHAGQRSAANTIALAGAQYLSFVYGAGVFTIGSSFGWSSRLASFSFSSIPSNRASIAAGTSALIYGADYINDVSRPHRCSGTEGLGDLHHGIIRNIFSLQKHCILFYLPLERISLQVHSPYPPIVLRARSCPEPRRPVCPTHRRMLTSCRRICAHIRSCPPCAAARG